MSGKRLTLCGALWGVLIRAAVIGDDAYSTADTNVGQVLWSWLLVARNDGYLGLPAERLATSLAALARGTAEHTLVDESEVVVVDWNSQTPFYRDHCHASVPRLIRDSLFNNPMLIRFVVVPPSLAVAYTNETLSEVHALNVAARHARGRMLLRIDQDTIVGRPIFHWLQGLKNSTALPEYLQRWWWCGRRDVAAEDYDSVVADPLGFLDHHGARIQKWGWPNPTYGGNFSRDGRGGVGIFGVPKAVWRVTGGLDETMTAWGHMELEFQRRIRAHVAVLNLDDVLPGEIDQPVFHLYHPRYSGGANGQRRQNILPPLPDPAQLAAQDARRSTLGWGLHKARDGLVQAQCKYGACILLAGPGASGGRVPCKWDAATQLPKLVSDELKRRYADSLDVWVVGAGNSSEHEAVVNYLNHQGIIASTDSTMDVYMRHKPRPLRHSRTPVLFMLHAPDATHMSWLAVQRHSEMIHLGTIDQCKGLNATQFTTSGHGLRDPLGIASQLHAFLSMPPTARGVFLRHPFTRKQLRSALHSIGLGAQTNLTMPLWRGDPFQGRQDTIPDLVAQYKPLSAALRVLPHVIAFGEQKIRLLRATALVAWGDEQARAKLRERFCPVPKLVDRTMDPWERIGGVSHAQVSSALASKAGEGCFLVQWIGGRLFTAPKPCTNERFPCTLFRTRRQNALSILRRALEASPIQDFEAAICLGDCVVSEAANASSRHLGGTYPFVADPLPAFVISGCSSSLNIRFPIWDNYAPTDAAWSRKVASLRAFAASNPWHSRAEQAIFRGGQRTCTKLSPPAANLGPHDSRVSVQPGYTAMGADDPYAEHCGRTGLLHKALTSSLREKFNVSLTSGYDFAKWYKQYGPPSSPTFVPFFQFGSFKFIIYAEGHCHYANRLRSLLFLDAILLKQEVECCEFYDMLRPWVHYVPVSYTFSNLTQAMRWALENPRKLRQMRENVREYAQATLEPRRVLAYTQQVLERYAALLTYQVRLHKDATLEWKPSLAGQKESAVKLPELVERDPSPRAIGGRALRNHSLVKPKNRSTQQPACCPRRYNFVPYQYNFGDAVGEPLMEFVSFPAKLGRFEAYGSQAGRTGVGGCSTSPVIVGLGSVLHHAFPPTSVLWGTGHIGNPRFFDPVQLRKAHKAFDVRAVRGTLTLQFIQESYPESQTHTTALGDPALLLPLAKPDCRRMCVPVHAVCVIPHNNDRHDPSLRRMPENWSVRHVQTPWEDMLLWVLGCGLVLSSSLHGIIFAEAFGVPARWVQLDGSKRSESWFKYVDYYSASRPALARAYSEVQVSLLSNRTQVFPDSPVIPLARFGVAPASSLEEGARMGGSPGMEAFDATALLRSFPSDITQVCQQQSRREAVSPDAVSPLPMRVGKALACANQTSTCRISLKRE